MRTGQWLATVTMVALLAAGHAGATEHEYERAASDRMLPEVAMTAGQVEGMTLYSEQGDALGEIEAVLVTPAGVFAGIGVEVGGFLGIGERDVLLRPGQFRRAGDRIITLLSRAQLEVQPEWDD